MLPKPNSKSAKPDIKRSRKCCTSDFQKAYPELQSLNVWASIGRMYKKMKYLC
jgi:hypothetical protein